jgi:hypothetical protein
MGYLEAAVVVYLRAALGIVPSAVPALDPEAFGAFEAIEIARELATLVMIAAVGWLAGRGRLERLAWAAVVFGLWDIVYLRTRVAIGWPPAIDTWDVLFLVRCLGRPGLGACRGERRARGLRTCRGTPASRRAPDRGGRPPGDRRARGNDLVIASFRVDADRVLAGDVSSWTGWPSFGPTGLAMLVTLGPWRKPMRAQAPGASSGDRLPG